MAALEFSESQVEITVRYLSREIIRTNVDCSDGCCVYYQMHSCEHAPSRKLVELVPYAGDDESRNETEFTNILLMGMKNGLLLEYDNNDQCIYAKRRCRTVIYYHSSQYHNDNPVKIAMDQRVKIFDYQAFKRQLITWLQNNVRKPVINRTKPFKRHKIFFSFGQTWQPYLERHKELGENRPQPTALDSRLVSMVVVPLKAEDMVMATSEGRESSETISMEMNPNFLFISLEGSSQFCSSLEMMAQKIRRLEEQDRQRLQQPENMSIVPQTSSCGRLLEDCLDLQGSFEERLNDVLQRQSNPHQQCQQPQQYNRQMEQHQWTEQQH